MALERFLGGCIAFAPGHRLHVLARRMCDAADVYLAQVEGQVQGLGERLHEGGVGVGVGASQLVVHMEHRNRAHMSARMQLGAQVGQGRGIRAARHHQQYRRVGCGQVALAYGLKHLLEGA